MCVCVGPESLWEEIPTVPKDPRWQMAAAKGSPIAAARPSGSWDAAGLCQAGVGGHRRGANVYVGRPGEEREGLLEVSGGRAGEGDGRGPERHRSAAWGEEACQSEEPAPAGNVASIAPEGVGTSGRTDEGRRRRVCRRFTLTCISTG